MGELYNEESSRRRSEDRKQGERSQQRLFMLGVILLVLVVLGVGVWRRFHDPATAILNLNTASESQLETLPGVGPETAKSIIKGRPYKAPDDLKNVKGIGDKTMEKIRPRVKVE